MSLEAIKQITETERACEQRKTEAAQQARRMVAEAEKAGQAALEARRVEAERQAKEILAQAETHATERMAEVAKRSEQVCAELCNAAEGRLDAAADLIVRRVVSG